MENNLRTTAIGGAGFALLCALTDLYTAMFAALVLACAAAVFGAGVALGFAGVSAVGCVADSTRGSRTLRGLRLALYTPPFAFCLLCLALPVALEPIAPLGEPLGLPFLLAWPVLLWCAVALAVVAWTFAGSGAQSVATLGRADAWIASWYLCNGFFFNSMMDVFAGLLQAWPTMTGRYNELEPRYALAGTCAGVTVVLTSWQELLVQAPCGLALFYAYWRGAPWQLPLEIVFNSWSVAGVLYFYGSEPALGFPHVHAPFSGGAKTPDPVSGVAAPLVFDAAEATSFASLYKVRRRALAAPAPAVLSRARTCRARMHSLSLFWRRTSAALTF